ncbi:hypothetical protein COV24_00960 [candidate division WWE3 bacterium CG10_big_fil_rev_8_21_14_0_10_32_10]|uniref:SpoVT-AbrB domain-containing protein n=1 Tax=candidate division WWE3 bacterium CG10_big_fil_rev_8_21_14_0_10_32_10 TaxID=1975090 RepID=A0A2H0RCL8_UNCKA|nr:MAG: hypothetical protein COV24_00960 [candidate division WWE3 bacterium CG10_big_fil_rev_8_21_14_0_10_32_10]
MSNITSLTQKGQVVIPKSIRNHFNLKAFDKLFFRIENNKIVAEPVNDTNGVFGMFKTNSYISKQKQKSIVKKFIESKFKK